MRTSSRSRKTRPQRKVLQLAPTHSKGQASRAAACTTTDRLRRRLFGALRFVRGYVAIDLRALGLFRIAFGLVLLADLADRMRGTDFTAFYTDDGVLPVSEARAIGVLRPTLFALASTPRPRCRIGATACCARSAAAATSTWS